MGNRVMIAGTGSGCGKTTITCALLAALASVGKDVISFKCGPDYIDPMFHKKATGVESRNLDVFLMGEEGIKYSMAHHAAKREIAVLEGVMGLYDGLGNGSFSSSNHVSILTNTPVILIVNAKGAALSICAMIMGFLEFEQNNIRGIILNNISEAMFPFYKQMIEERLNIAVIGFMPYISNARIESRYLGLVSTDEIVDIKEKIHLLAENAIKFIDFNMLLSIAGQAVPPLGSAAQNPASPTDFIPVCFDYPQEFLPFLKRDGDIKLYIACDEAFSFWYEDNHDLLKSMGAEIKFFSPIHDRELPNDADGLVLWGGYPELCGMALEKNQSMRNSIKSAINAGVPVYAEGGGFMYLHECLIDLQGMVYKMAGVLPGKINMTDRLQNFGYYEIQAQKDNLLCKTGEKINAHFFRRSVSNNEGGCFKAVKQDGKTFPCIVSEKNIFAGYQHLHFFGNAGFAQQLISACIEYRNRRSVK